MITSEQFELEIADSLRTLRPKIEAGLGEVGEAAVTLAKSYLGHYQVGWAPLAESTIEGKIKQGYPVPSPLLRTGEMRDSIKFELNPTLLTLEIGSDEPKAMWHELGTSRIPPRPFLSLAVIEVMPAFEKIFNKIGATIMTEK